MAGSPRRSFVAFLLAPLVLAGAAQASNLALNGQSSLKIATGSSLTLSLAGAPGRPGYIFVDVSAGPTLIGGEEVPLGFTPQFKVAAFGLLDGAGKLVVAESVPDDPALAGLTLHLVGVVLDPVDPNGKDWSNAATLTIKSPAGEPQGSIVGRAVTLDGGVAAGVGGALPPDTTIAWAFVSVPPGSAAVLAGANGVTPSFVPDVAGDFVVRATLTQKGKVSIGETRVHAWTIHLTGLADGAFTAASQVTISGTAQGPPLDAVLVDAIDAPLFGNMFGPVVRSFAAGEAMLSVMIELRHADGSAARQRFTFIQGTSQSFTAAAGSALGVRLNQPGLDRLSDHVTKALAGTDLQAGVLALPNILVANEIGPLGIVIFSATLDFLGLKWNPGMNVSVAPSASGLLVAVAIPDVRTDFRVFGKLLNVPYDITGLQTSSTVTVTMRLVGSAVGGKVQMSVLDLKVASQGVASQLPGFLGSAAQALVITTGVQTNIEAVLGAEVSDRVRTASEEFLNSFAVEGNLAAALGANVDVTGPIAGVTHDSAGLTLRMDTSSHVLSVKPGSPAVTAFRVTAAALPPLGPLSPSGQPYGAALAVADDFVDQSFAAATAAGLLEGDLDALVPLAGEALLRFTSDQLNAIFPGGGFDLFPPGTLVVLRAHGTVPPLLRLTPLGPAMTRLDVRNLEVEFELPGAAGNVPLLRLALDGTLDLDLRLGADGAVAADIVHSAVTARVLRAFPGANLASFDAQAGLLLGVLINAMPQFAVGLSGLPVPSADEEGLVLTANEMALIGAASHVGFFGQLSGAPAP